MKHTKVASLFFSLFFSGLSASSTQELMPSESTAYANGEITRQAAPDEQEATLLNSLSQGAVTVKYLGKFIWGSNPAFNELLSQHEQWNEKGCLMAGFNEFRPTNPNFTNATIIACIEDEEEGKEPFHTFYNSILGELEGEPFFIREWTATCQVNIRVK